MESKNIIKITERHGIARRREFLRTGMPFGRGVVRNSAAIQLLDEKSNAVPLQVHPLLFWPDGSIKWALIDLFVDVAAESGVSLSLGPLRQQEGQTGASADSITIGETQDQIVVDTLANTFTIPKKGAKLIKEYDMVPRLETTDGSTAFCQIESASAIQTGPIRSDIEIKGRFRIPGGRYLNLRAIVSFYLRSPLVTLDIELHNPYPAVHPGGIWDLGDPGSIFFRDFSLLLELSGRPARLEWSTSPLKPCRTSSNGSLCLYQDSSGGINWNSPNHLGHDGKLTVSFSGYRVTENVRVADHPGERALPVFVLKTTEGCTAAGVKDFWQNFPKAMEAKGGCLRLGLFPGESVAPFELQGGEKKRHTVFCALGCQDDEDAIQTVSQALMPLDICLEPGWIAQTRAVPYFLPEDEDPNERYKDYVRNAIAGSRSFFAKREEIDEYGWRNFGDLYADHEAAFHKGSSLFISHYNNQYDFIMGAAINFLRSGRPEWFALMSDLARHVIDIDIYHTSGDRSSYNHGLFWHTDHYREAGLSTHRTFTRMGRGQKELSGAGGGPCNEHNYTTGLLYYYLLTGDRLAGEAVMELADWVIAMDDGKRSLFCILDQGPTGLASQTASPDYHGPGRGAGNSINALMDAYSLAGRRDYLFKAEEIIRRTVHPQDNIGSLGLDDPEHRWSYLVYLQALGKYLDLKLELGETDWMFFYARESLVHYAKWMLENEVPYKDVLHKVDIPTETWPAQDIRKAWILNVASRFAPKALAEPMRRRARFFFDRCLEDLLSFDTAYFTRPMVLLATYGTMQGYFDKHYERTQLLEEKVYDFGNPASFVPQRDRLKSGLKERIRIVYHEFKIRTRAKAREFRQRYKL